MKTLKYIVAIALVSGMFIDASAQKGKEKLDRSIRPTGGPAPIIQLKKPASFTLENGLKVFVVENHKSPKVSFSIQLNFDPFTEGDKIGTSDFSGQLLGTATTKRTKDQINEEVDFIGANLNAGSSGVSGNCLKKHLPKFMDLFADVLLNPVFNEAELEKLKTQTKSSLASERTSPASMAANIKAAVVYGKNHPYGEVMTEENVDNITIDDCKKYYESYFKPNVGYMAIVGDITIDEAKELCNKYFANWKKGDVPKSYIPPVKNPTQATVRFADKKGATQSTIHITYPIDLKPGSPDIIKVSVMDDILGGSFSARLFRNLRETYKLTYGAYSDCTSDKYVGNFDAHADVRTVATDSALTQFFYEINRMIKEPVSDEELKGVINNLTGKFSLSLEQPATIARMAINIDRYGLPDDYYANYLAELSKVTVADVQEMAKKYLKPTSAYIIIVGDKEKIAGDVLKYAADGKIHYYDSYGNDFVDLKKAPDGMTGDNVIEKYIAAMGGEAALKKVKSLKLVYSGSIQGQILEQEVNKKLTKAGDPMYKMTMKMGGMMVLQTTVFDGTTGYTADPQNGKKTLEGDDLAEMKSSAQLFPELSYKKDGIKVELLGIDKVDGKEAYKIEITESNGDKHFEWYDATSNLQIMNEVTNEGQTIQTKFSDYKEVTVKKVGTLKFPGKISADLGGMVIDFNSKELLVNPKLDDAIFSTK